MYRLLYVILFLGLTVNLVSQSPHGAQFRVNCADCHTSAGWEIPYDKWDRGGPVFSKTTGWQIGWDSTRFSHTKTNFPLTGQHIRADCRACHQSLVFSDANTTCISCHTDMHNGTVGNDCARCHNTDNWLVDNIPELHQDNGFPLVGAHAAATCADCHKSETALRFDRIGNDCINCHKNDYETAVNPNHQGANFSQNCIECHTTDPDWMPAKYAQHDADYFPIYSGAHKGAWNACQDCHTNPSNYAEFTCITCHTNPETDNHHGGVNGYTYSNPACLACHPTGTSDDVFDHGKTNFPLTGAHLGVDCAKCHVSGYTGTPTACAACHTPDYNQSANPSHTALAIPTDCATCHTTNGWSPATFAIHNSYYPLNGAHAAIANDCAACHNGDYTNTPNTCAGCHTPDYNQTTAPNHVAQQFPTDCASCHSETAWIPSTFDHNSVYPLTGAHATIANDCNVCHNGDYANTPNTCAGCHTPDYNQSANPNHVTLGIPTDCATCHTPDGWSPATFAIHNNYYPLNGAHAAIANDCAACHNGDYNNTPNTCAGCHTPDYNQTTDPNHVAQQFPIDCAACHGETAWIPSTFNHNDVYPLTGAHATIANDCNACHKGDYTNTPNTCAGCHTPDYNQTTNPNHAGLALPTDCASCHTPDGWSPAQFPIHNNYYPLNGAHAAIANDCAACHNGDYTNTPNTCAGCHISDYNQTTDPNHIAAQFPTDCAGCHGETSWEPATFDHDGQYFPIYSGKHKGEWDQCYDCHINQSNYAEFTCTTCHTNPETNNQHNGVNGYTYNSPACLACHPTGDGDNVFNHNNSAFPLTGAHLLADCIDCHALGYVGTPTACVACHTPDYNQSANPNHVALAIPTDCASCHTPDGWSPATFAIHNNYYPLNGAHAAIANDCAACHNGDYNNTPNTCAGCHTPDYNQTTNPNHAAQQFPTDCAMCHSETAWTPSTFDHNSVYPLTGAHATISNDCNACHNGNYTNTPNTCAGCHTPDYNQSANPNHVSLGIPTDCAMCHTPDGWSPATFAIHNNYYPLNGAHAAIANDCAACHNGNYNNTPNTCAGCHTGDYNQTTNPNHTAQQFPTDCAICHSETAWAPATFDHNGVYPLTGAHATIANDCNACHNGNYTNTPNTCAGCHTPDYNQSANPNHVSLGIPTDCAMCHTNDGWEPAAFPIHNNYYQLNGAHAAIANDCAACHNGDYNNTPNTCAGCHTPDYNQTTNPNHAAQQFPTDCTICHNETAWIPSIFDHNSIYPLTGAHAAIANDCNVCHNGNYTNTPNTCAGCHTPDYNQSANPNHQSLGIPTDCAICHTPDGWEPAAFPIHNNYYPLNGAHAAIANDCAACHNGNYNNTPNTCAGCHQADYNQTTNPNHAAQQFPTDCAICHSEAAWVPSTFDHNSVYPLTGAHATIANDCNACHNGNYTNTPNTCAGCHTPDYNQSANPNHQSLGIPTDCALCHTSDGWEPAEFPIHNNYYQLNGAHAAIANDCAACHNGNYNNTPNTCAGCHQADYNQTTNPNHAAQQFPTDCTVCHGETAWIPSIFDHNSVYPLTGAHATIANDCNACHNGNYTNTPNTCAGCHTPDYNQSTNPNHVALGIPTDCALCHTPDGWEPAEFPIHNNYYPLNGAHAAIANDCNTCHNGNYNNTPNTCVGCHLPDYNQANNPNHASAGFPTTCQDCHGETVWVPANFDHDGMYFPIYSGKHDGEWDQCTDCHTTPGNFSIFSCLGCHTNPETNNDHQGVPGYVYSSPACYACHPDGED